MKFQLIALDEYRSTTIIGTFGDIVSAITKARDMVTDANVRNALSTSERERFWEAYFVDFFNGEEFDNKLVYACNLPDGKKQKAYLFEDGEVQLVEIADDASMRFYLGELEDKSPWYLKTFRGEHISDLKHEDLVGKTVYFIQAVK